MPRVSWLAAVGSFAAGALLFPLAIAGLGRAGLRQVEREEGPRSHLVKSGTPTAGGVFFVLVAVVAWAAAIRDAAGGMVVAAAVLGMLVGVGDDLLKARTGQGLRVRPKFILLALCAAVLALGMHAAGPIPQTVPVVGPRDLGAAWLALGAFAALAASNGVNLADGVDGLSAGCALPAFLALGAMAQLEHRGLLAATCWCLAAAVLAFLLYNRPRARVFMGDSGALALGLALAVAAAEVGGLVLLPLLGAVFLAEALSVIAQVSFFKLTGGRRLLRMSPLHHHFELGGLGEWAVDLRFWAAAWTCAALALGWAIWSGLALGGPR